jgi:Fungalysin metallopeptidase (M36)/Peptidase family M28
MSAISCILFDLGDTLGTAVFSASPVRLIRFDVFPFVPSLLKSLRDRGLRLGIISNTGDMSGAEVDAVLAPTGIRDDFEPALRIYSTDVGLTKDSPAIFRLAAQRVDLAETPQRCLFVGEDGRERGFALDAGLLVAPHPLLIDEVLAGQPLRFMRVTARPGTPATAFHAALRRQPLVALHVEGQDAGTVYAVSSQRASAQLINMRLHVELLGPPDLPARSDLYILRDDAAVRSGFLSPDGQAAQFFSSPAAAPLLLASAADGVLVALPDGRSPGEFHFAGARHGHTLKLLPDPSLLETVSGIAEAERESPAAFAPPRAGVLVDPTAKAAFAQITPETIVAIVERYSGARPLSQADPDPIHSRHLANRDGDNQRAVKALASELEAIGGGRLAVRLTQFLHRGITLQNVEAELPGQSPELVLVTAHLDSTAANDPDFDEAHGAAPGADDDGSGIAAVLMAAERLVALSVTGQLARTVRFVLFNAEEEGLVGSRVYARQQRAAGALIIAVLQMDMIAYHVSGPRVWEIHSGFAPSLAVAARSAAIARLVRQVAPEVSPSLGTGEIYNSADDPAAGRSDHASFQAQGYPAVVISENFFTGPAADSPAAQANPQYHSAGDTFVDAGFAADIARVVAATAWVIATGGTPPTSFTGLRGFAPHRETEMPQREFDSRKRNGTTHSRRVPITPLAPAATPAAATFTSHAAPVGGPRPSLVDRALAFVHSSMPSSFGAAAGEQPTFFPDPVVQRTSAGAAAVHLHQQYHGLTIFQMARSVRFAPDGRALDAVGETSSVPAGLNLEPKIDAAAAVVKAAQHLAATGAGQTETDRFGVSNPVPTIDVAGFNPAVIASFPLPSRATVLEQGPFENPIPTYLLIFDHPAGPRLAWHSVLTFPNYEDQYVVIVSADDRPGEILYSNRTLHRATARGNVYEFSPGVADRRLIDFPRPLADYPVMPTTPLVGFPADWVESQQTLGNSTRAVLNFTTSTLSAPAGTPVVFNPDNKFGDDQKLLNIFYFCNYMHDFLYLIGFDEAAGNFQQINFTHTGVANDPVLAHAHSGPVSGTANMATGPDGKPPVMNMGLVSGDQHTAFDADVVFHEYTHGLTNRLVGGLMQGHALDAPQSSGMGEGWSDYFALTIQNFFRARNGQPEKVVIGDWVVNRPGGIRTAPYDDNYPIGYAGIAEMSDEHDVGEIWCAAIMMVTRRVRATLGSDVDGYRLCWTLMTDGLKLTPANPSFIDARDGILLALDHLRDQHRISQDVWRGVRKAAWEGFAHFGMGAHASSADAELSSATADTSLPADL